MRIAYLGPSPSETGGVAYAARILLEALLAEGVEIDLYAGSCPPSLAGCAGLRPMLEPVGQDPVFLRLARAPLVKFVWGQSRRALAQRRLVDRLIAEHRRRPYDVVYQFSQPELLALRSRRHELPPIVVHPEVHAAGELRGHRLEDALARVTESRLRTAGVRLMLSIRSALQRRDLMTVAAVIAPSAGFARELVRDYGVSEHRIHVVPNPVDLRRFVPGEESARPREILFVSRMAVRKGVELFVELSHRLSDLAGDVRLIAIGDGTMWSDYRPLLDSLDPRVAEYRGYVEPSELPHVIQRASLLLQPSHYEPFALTVAEALACGTPVVVSDQVGAGEWLDDRCSASFAAGDVDALEHAVRSLLARLETSETEIREHARQAAESSFAPAIAAAGVLRVLQNVTRQPRRLLVVSHPCVVDVNQSVYRELKERGWDVRIVVPSTWSHEYTAAPVRPATLAGLEGALMPLPVFLRGRPQRHGYRARPGNVIAALRPDVIFLEQEPFSVAALQWGVAAARAGVPFGVQAAENMDRPFPWPARLIRAWVLPRVAFVAARSPAAAELAVRWGARGTISVAPHAVPSWPPATTADRNGHLFTVGYAGRLVPEKGIDDLLAAVRRLDPPFRLLVAGGGPLHPQVEAAERDGVDVEVLTGLSHDQVGAALREMDVLVLPSRSTATWTEQFGRVLVEAMSERVPVVGSDSGEIPWVIQTTGGGIVVPEGDVEALADAIGRLRSDPVLRSHLGARGSESVARLFSVAAATDSLEALIRGAL